jgi:predicted lipid-binding transport protein (Tim44 family)
MSRIVAARFDRSVDADAAIEALRDEGFAGFEIESFYLAPPGQHGTYPLGGDAHSDAGARFGGWGAFFGALIGAGAGLALGTLASLERGLVAVLLAMGIGAYVGSFIGAMAKMRAGRNAEASAEHPVESPAGRMVAVNVDRPRMEDRAIAALKRHAARDVGRAEGDWRNGSWRDFDPRSPLRAA